MDINSIRSAALVNQKQQIGKAAASANGEGFTNSLGDVLKKANDMQQVAEKTVQDFAAGKIENVHEVMIAEAEAEISFKMLVQTRNKVVEAYKEIMRMQL